MGGQSSKPNREADFNDYYRRSVAPHLHRILAVGRRILGSQDLAWDAFQEALVSLWQLTDRPADPTPWLIQTMINRSLHLRRSQERRFRNEQTAGGMRGERVGPNPAQNLERQEWQQLLQDAMNQLPDEYRHVFLLRETEQLSYEAIALQLHLPVGTVRSRLNRARLTLRRLLADSIPEQQGCGNLGEDENNPGKPDSENH